MKTLLSLLVVALAIGAFSGMRHIKALQARSAAIEVQKAEVARLNAENIHIDKLLKENEEATQLREESRDLHKLRNEVRQLREQVNQLPGLREENQKLKTRLSASSNGGSSLSQASVSSLVFSQMENVGQATPEATVQSWFWAIREVDRDALIQFSLPKAVEQQGFLKSQEPLERMAKEMSAKVVSIRIPSKKQISEKEVQIAVIFDTEDGTESGLAFTLKKIGRDWKVSSIP